MVYVLLLFFVCYILFLIVMVVCFLIGYSFSVKMVYEWGVMIVYLNLMLNLLFYWFRMEEICLVIYNVIRKL